MAEAAKGQTTPPLASSASSKPVKRKGNMLHNILIGIISIGMILLLQVGFLFFLIGLIPTIVAFFIDQTEQRNIYKCVRACNLAGILPQLGGLLGGKIGGTELLNAMRDPSAWAMVYGAAIIGWSLVWICKNVTYAYVMVSNQALIAYYQKTQDKLLQEWGEMIKRRDLAT